jgi:mannose-6-phosphate isomerase-like protein (cupin superfamily)
MSPRSALAASVLGSACVLASPFAVPAAAAPGPSRIDLVRVETQAWYEASDRAVAREIASPRNSGLKGLSIADIKVPAGVEVKPHHHHWEEVYFVTAGKGRMRVGDLVQDIEPGDAVIIPPDVWHSVASLDGEELRLIVTCAPSWQADGLEYE